jgi:hypothetical protein
LLLDLPLERGVNPAADENGPLRNACFWGHTEIVRMLLDLPPEKRVNPVARDNEGFRMARARGHTDIVCMLKAKIPWYRRLFK